MGTVESAIVGGGTIIVKPRRRRKRRPTPTTPTWGTQRANSLRLQRLCREIWSPSISRASISRTSDTSRTSQKQPSGAGTNSTWCTKAPATN